MNNTTAQVSFNLYLRCPHCKQLLDLMDEDDVDEFAVMDGGSSTAVKIIKRWFNNAPYEVESGICQHCNGTFEVERVEW